eukprot:1318774-Amphidinium_carterae.1
MIRSARLKYVDCVPHTVAVTWGVYELQQVINRKGVRGYIANASIVVCEPNMIKMHVMLSFINRRVMPAPHLRQVC